MSTSYTWKAPPKKMSSTKRRVVVNNPNVETIDIWALIQQSGPRRKRVKRKMVAVYEKDLDWD